ncbi:IS1380-like element ISMsm3 family transposase [Nocardiopsis rhodophaea]|uniref:IS1380-like element ISMsm3 family transposase n=1 Tax=Nocardiopsis rhodophaea TaxID=280238 RepID=A0ABN2SNI8_9ACTN
MHDTEWPDGLCVAPQGKNIVGHVGGLHLRLLAQRTGLTTALSTALKPTRPRPWDRGQLLADLACAITLGATNIRDISLLDHHRPVIGPTASTATTWRMLDATGPRLLARIARARAAVRRHVWNLLDQRPDGFPQVRIDGAPLTGVTVIDSDATIIESASAKQGARGTFKGTYGHHPLTAYCANTHEMLVADLREGSAAPNHPGDNIAVLPTAVDQVPGPYRRRVLFRLDGAGASKDLLGWIASAGGRTSPCYTWEYSAGWPVGEREQAAIEALDRLGLWEAATGADRQARQDAVVADITGLLGDLHDWPKGHRVIVRKEPLHPRYERDATDYEKRTGQRYQAFSTNTARGQSAFLDARHRHHATVEQRIRDSKACGLGRLPSRHAHVNAAWLCAVAIAADLRAWLQLLALSGELAAAAPKTLRLRLLHVAARLVHGQRKRRLKVDATWPWAAQIAAAFRAIRALPSPART